MYNFTEIKTKIAEVEEWLKKELSLIRTGKATPVILDFVQVDAYGSKMSIKELANVLIEDSKTVKVEPWDMTLSNAIQKGIDNANLGLSVSPYDKGLRIIFPELTSERREQFVKVVKSKLEEARISLRSLREKNFKIVDEKQKSGDMSEDDKFKIRSEIQKHIDSSSKNLEEIANKKESEIKG